MLPIYCHDPWHEFRRVVGGGTPVHICCQADALQRARGGGGGERRAQRPVALSLLDHSQRYARPLPECDVGAADCLRPLDYDVCQVAGAERVVIGRATIAASANDVDVRLRLKGRRLGRRRAACVAWMTVASVTATRSGEQIGERTDSPRIAQSAGQHSAPTYTGAQRLGAACPGEDDLAAA